MTCDDIYIVASKIFSDQVLILNTAGLLSLLGEPPKLLGVVLRPVWSYYNVQFKTLNFFYYILTFSARTVTIASLFRAISILKARPYPLRARSVARTVLESNDREQIEKSTAAAIVVVRLIFFRSID